MNWASSTVKPAVLSTSRPMTQLKLPTPPPAALSFLPLRSAALLIWGPTTSACGRRGAMPHTWWAFTPWPMAVALMLLITEPRATAVMLVCDRPPSNCTMSASMQRLAKIPSPRATNGGVWTTFGGATDTPRVTFRMGPLHEAAAWAGAAPAEKTTGSALAEGLASAAPLAAGLAAALPAGLAEALAEGLASAAALVEGLAEALDGGALARSEERR